tara:strand:- start:415 stop:603 length:189 start_codon:yes stop_codon:yes gene_type:complete
LKLKYVKTAVARLHGEKSGSVPGMKLDSAARNARLNQKKVNLLLELDSFNTILISKGTNNYG